MIFFNKKNINAISKDIKVPHRNLKKFIYKNIPHSINLIQFIETLAQKRRDFDKICHIIFALWKSKKNQEITSIIGKDGGDEYIQFLIKHNNSNFIHPKNLFLKISQKKQLFKNKKEENFIKNQIEIKYDSILKLKKNTEIIAFIENNETVHLLKPLLHLYILQTKSEVVAIDYDIGNQKNYNYQYFEQRFFLFDKELKNPKIKNTEKKQIKNIFKFFDVNIELPKETAFKAADTIVSNMLYMTINELPKLLAQNKQTADLLTQTRYYMNLAITHFNHITEILNLDKIPHSKRQKPRGLTLKGACYNFKDIITDKQITEEINQETNLINIINGYKREKNLDFIFYPAKEVKDFLKKFNLNKKEFEKIAKSQNADQKISDILINYMQKQNLDTEKKKDFFAENFNKLYFYKILFILKNQLSKTYQKKYLNEYKKYVQKFNGNEFFIDLTEGLNKQNKKEHYKINISQEIKELKKLTEVFIPQIKKEYSLKEIFKNLQYKDKDLILGDIFKNLQKIGKKNFKNLKNQKKLIKFFQNKHDRFGILNNHYLETNTELAIRRNKLNFIIFDINIITNINKISKAAGDKYIIMLLKVIKKYLPKKAFIQNITATKCLITLPWETNGEQLKEKLEEKIENLNNKQIKEIYPEYKKETYFKDLIDLRSGIKGIKFTGHTFKLNQIGIKNWLKKIKTDNKKYHLAKNIISYLKQRINRKHELNIIENSKKGVINCINPNLRYLINVNKQVGNENLIKLIINNYSEISKEYEQNANEKR